MSSDYLIRRSTRATRLRIVVKADRVELVAPVRMPESQIHHFAQTQKDWIRQAQQRVLARSQKTVAGFAPEEYKDGVSLPFLNQKLILRLCLHNQKRLSIEGINSTTLLIKLPETLQGAPRQTAIRAALEKWFKQQAQFQVEELVSQHAPRFNLQPRSIRIKTQKSRWGSCGPQNDINLNWLLMLAPAAALEYVVVHELCHIRHKNHSAAFWDLVAQHLPDYQQQRQWLKQHGQALMQGL